MSTVQGVSCSKLLFLLVIVHCGFLPFAVSKVRDLDDKEFEALANSPRKSFTVVYFDRAEARKANPKFVREYAVASDALETFNIELTKIDCRVHRISHCVSGSDLYVVLYRDGTAGDPQKLSLDALYDRDSITARILEVSLEEDVRYISDTSVFSGVVSEARGKKDLVFGFVKAFGIKEHRYFLESAFAYLDEMTFAITTDPNIAKSAGLPNDVDFALGLFHCKGHSSQSLVCPATIYNGRAQSVSLARFLQSSKLPKTVFLGSDGKTEYDSAVISINKVYVFTTEPEQLKVSQLEKFSAEMQGAVGIIIVDANQHKELLPEFGLSAKSSFPTAAFVPDSTVAKEKSVELYPEISPFSVESLKHFILPFLENPDEEYKRLAFSSDLHNIPFTEYADSMRAPLENNYVLSSLFTVVAFCRPSHEACEKFHPAYRRLARTLSRSGNSIGVYYVDTTQLPEDNKHHDLNVEPIVRIFNRSRKYRAYADEMTYHGMLDFVAHRTEMDITPLPVSASDFVPIESTAEDGNTTSVESGLPEEETEDDEVAAGVLMAGYQPPPPEVVPSLTDKTFDSTKQSHDLLVVHFLQPWDVRCKAFTKLYTNAAQSLGSADVGEFSIRLAQVNCFDWTDVCKENNITCYPTIKIYRGSKELNYQGPLDSEHLIKTVLLLRSSSPMVLKSQEEAEQFLDGKFPRTSGEALDLSVLGMFSQTSGKEFEAFTSTAASLEGKFLLGHVSGDIAEKLAQDYGLSLPAVLISKRRDALRPLAVFKKRFTKDNLEEFVQLSKLPVFGELTVLNLPLYRQHSKPLVIIFRENESESFLSPVIADLAGQGSQPSVFFCSMKVEKDSVNADILQSYVGEGKVPALVMVDHSKGAVFQFKGEASKSVVSSWITRCLIEDQEPTKFLKEGRWPPLLEGYDFLDLIKKQEMEKKKKWESVHDDDDDDDDEDDDGFVESDAHAGGEDQEPEQQQQQETEALGHKSKRGRLGKPTGSSHDEL